MLFDDDDELGELVAQVFNTVQLAELALAVHSGEGGKARGEF